MLSISANVVNRAARRVAIATCLSRVLAEPSGSVVEGDGSTGPKDTVAPVDGLVTSSPVLGTRTRSGGAGASSSLIGETQNKRATCRCDGRGSVRTWPFIQPPIATTLRAASS